MADPTWNLTPRIPSVPFGKSRLYTVRILGGAERRASWLHDYPLTKTEPRASQVRVTGWFEAHGGNRCEPVEGVVAWEDPTDG